jgi:hypothetical protein
MRIIASSRPTFSVNQRGIRPAFKACILSSLKEDQERHPHCPRQSRHSDRDFSLYYGIHQLSRDFKMSTVLDMIDMIDSHAPGQDYAKRRSLDWDCTAVLPR